MQPSSYPALGYDSMEENLPLKDDGTHEHKLSLGTRDSPEHAGASLPRSKWKVAGSSARSGRVETTKLPKVTSGHPPMVLTSSDSLEKGYLERKLGELGRPSYEERAGDGKHPEMAGTPPPEGETSCPGFQ